MEKKNAKKRAGKYAEYQGGKKAEICVKLHISFFYKGLKCEDLQKRHRKQIYDQIKRRYNSWRNKIHCSFLLNFVLKKFI